MNLVKKLSHCNCDKLTGGHAPGWFERLLMFLIPHFDIIKTIDTGHPWGKLTVMYLRRFYLFRSKWFGLNFGDLYLHHIIRSDDDPSPHDHPWSFKGFVIKGGYIDEQYQWIPSFIEEVKYDAVIKGIRPEFNMLVVGDRKFISTPGRRLGPFHEKVKPLSFVSRAAEHIHRVILPEGKTAWTLIVTNGYSRDWNFITETGPVFWRTFLGIPSDVDVGE